MATHLILLCCAATASARMGGFAGRDEPLDPGGEEKARGRSLVPRPGLIVRSPARAAAETAAAMKLDAAPDERLADMDFGAWTGRFFEAIHAEHPADLAAWIAEPARGAPRGEDFDQVRRRVGPWLAEMAEREGTVLAITHASTIRAALAVALDLPDHAVMRIDMAPLSVARLSFHRGWRLQALGEG